MPTDVTVRYTKRITRGLLIAGVIGVGGFHLLPDSKTASASVPLGVAAELGATAPAAPSSRAYSGTTTCLPMALWNPDAGLGLVRCGNGYSSINVENETTTAVKFVWRYKTGTGSTLTPVTRADLDTFGMTRKASGNNGASYAAEITGGDMELFCVTQADAGQVLPKECAR